MSTSNRQSTNATLLFLVTVSAFGLVMVISLTVSPLISQGDLVWRKPVIGAVFASICVLGSLAALFPNECSTGFNFGPRRLGAKFFLGFKIGSKALKSDPIVLRGHHPLCVPFSSHVFKLNGRVFCATCSGLFLGALVALIGVAGYFFGNWQIGQGAFWLAWVGVLGVTIGLLQSILPVVQRSFVRVFSGAFLAVGSLLILAVVDEMAHNLLLDVFLIFLTLVWLVTRISLSQREHEKICYECGSASCEFAESVKK